MLSDFEDKIASEMREALDLQSADFSDQTSIIKKGIEKIENLATQHLPELEAFVKEQQKVNKAMSKFLMSVELHLKVSRPFGHSSRPLFVWSHRSVDVFSCMWGHTTNCANVNKVPNLDDSLSNLQAKRQNDYAYILK